MGRKRAAKIESSQQVVRDRLAKYYADTMQTCYEKAFEQVVWADSEPNTFTKNKGTSFAIAKDHSRMIMATCGIMEYDKGVLPFYRWEFRTYFVCPKTLKIRALSLMTERERITLVNVAKAFSKEAGRGPTNHHFNGGILILWKGISDEEAELISLAKQERLSVQNEHSEESEENVESV